MIYLDTSVVVPFFVPEAASAAVDEWLADCDEPLIASDWLLTEFSSALALKTRRGDLTPAQADTARADFDAFCAGGLRLFPVSRAAFAHAAALTRDAASGLRAGDALHLAAALECGASGFATADATLAANAERLQLAVLRF